MKLVTYSWKGDVAPGALSHGRVVDLRRAHEAAAGHAGDGLGVAGVREQTDLLELLRGGPAALATARRALRFVEGRGPAGATDDWCPAASDVEIRAPVLRPGKVVCVGLNYRSHLAEIGERPSEYPTLFLKTATSVIGHGQTIVLPRVSRQVDLEGELAVIIGRKGKYISKDDALSFVAGYTCANDVSAHDIEFRTSQWTSGKMLDTFCPLGPVLVTADEISNPNALRLRTTHNGKIVQDASTSDMIFSVPFLISYISSLATLEPGDVILTGTPAGIGCNRDPPVFLQPGDRVSVEIDGIGTLTNPVAAEEGR
jgi:acylpyruvate hydrolase